MKLLFFCPRWGQEHLSWNEFAQKVKAAGYDGVEASLPLQQKETDDILDILTKYGLRFIAQHWETVQPDFDQHYAVYEKRLRWLATVQPLFINTQTGKDYYTFAQNERLIALAQTIAAETGISILHETHRGKFSFAAHITQYYLQQLPHLHITLDISHWYAVAESFLHDQREAVALAISRTKHIHARIGFTEGPQVTDPQAPEWQEAVNAHLQCWDKVIALQKQQGASYFTITPEFGAPPYLPLLPYTRQPLVDQWTVNVYMMNLLRERYASLQNI